MELLDYQTRVDFWEREQDAVYFSEFPDSVRAVAQTFESISGQGLTTDRIEELMDLERASDEFLTARGGFFRSVNIPSRPADRCAFCANNLIRIRDEEAAGFATYGEEATVRFSVQTCSSCGWWQARVEHMLRYSVGNASGYDWQCLTSNGALRAFGVAEASVPADVLRHYLDQHPDKLVDIHPYALEALVGAIFSEHMDCEAVHLGGPGDGGIDLILLNSDNPVAVQVKRRSTKKAESVQVVREFIGALLLAEQGSGMIVTTAPRFSSAALEAGRRATRIGIVSQIDLIDYDRLVAMMRATAKDADAWEELAPAPSSELWWLKVPK